MKLTRILLLTIFIGSILSLNGVYGKTWTVDDDLQDYPEADYTSIQEAIDAADVDDIVNVYSGVYREHLLIEKPITLVSVSGNKLTKIKGIQEEQPIISIKTDNATIEGFLITSKEPTYNTGIQGRNYIKIINCVITGNAEGVSLSSHSYIYDCNISNNRNHGIRLNANNTIDNNIISNNGNGISSENDNWIINNKIYETSSTGLSVSRYNIIYNNTLYNNNHAIHLGINNTIIKNILYDNNLGIRLGEISYNNTILLNLITGNGNGISLYKSKKNSIYCNDIYSNFYGIDLVEAHNNNIYINNFYDPKPPFGGKVVNTHPDYIPRNIKHRNNEISNNVWNSKIPLQYNYGNEEFLNILGNYWDEYEIIDANNDGVNDMMHKIYTNEDNKPTVGVMIFDDIVINMTKYNKIQCSYNIIINKSEVVSSITEVTPTEPEEVSPDPVETKEESPEEVEETSGGIPSFPLLAVFVSLMMYIMYTRSQSSSKGSLQSISYAHKNLFSS